ncbi:MAG: bifunctional riboflavin kinase/FAD synthetase [Proteobacteria bacterium]|nr:bifunctional riboflavin kinase/FAD synthetase [Pseudomonadota bacterium]
MKTLFGSDQATGSFPPPCVVALGNFDGVHLGHQSILAFARAQADRLGLPLACFTFNPHPTLELKPESNLKLLMTYDEKRAILESSGVDVCVEERFTAEFAKTSARDFFFGILRDRIRARAIVVGTNFSFGRNREGSIDRMRELCAESGIELYAIEPAPFEGSPVSSSRIRRSLAEGQVAQAAQMLGRPFFYRAEVVHGDKRGRTIGFPTANMQCAEKFPLRTGVYATSVLWRGVEYPAVTNIGIRPTFDSTELRVETHILDQTFDLYGERLEVRFHERIRDEQKFSSIDELKAQIAADVKLARTLLSSRNF